MPQTPQRQMTETQRERLLLRYAELRRPDDLEALVVSYQPLAAALARRYSRGPAIDADLEQAACEGLVKALQRFVPARGTPFTSFAVPTILGEVRRHLRDATWPAHVPRRVKDRVLVLRRAAEALGSSQGRPPSTAQLAAAVGLSEEDVVEVLTAASSARPSSLDAHGTDADGGTLADRLGDLDPGYDHVECLVALEREFPKLPVEQQTVVRLRFGGDLTQRQIAERLGVSRSHVGRLLGSALEELRSVAA